MPACRIGNHVLRVGEGRYSFTTAGGRLGWRELGLAIATHKGGEWLAQTAVRAGGRRIILEGRYAEAGVTETVTFRLGTPGVLVMSRVLRNDGAGAVTLQEARAGRIGGRGSPVFGDSSMWRARFAHLDNLRAEEVPWCRPEYPYVRPLPRTPTWFGNQESQAVPALLLTNDTYSEALVEGQLRQDRARLRWQLAAAPRALFADYLAGWEFHTGGLLLAPGETLALEPLYYQILTDTRPQAALDGYFRAVAQANDLRQQDNILHSRAFYCSWNYGIMHDISEQKLLKTARFIGRHVPGISHFLIDGGWQDRPRPWCPDFSNFYLKDERRYGNRRLFPHGMDGMAARIRQAGLKPALWWTPAVALHSRLAREQPHWLARNESGAPYRIGFSGYLDYSQPEVQTLLHHTFRTLFRAWGYEALKMDFWSQSVESNSIRFRSGTGIQWRDWLLATIRSYLPDDGFLMTCVATAMGNPFLGKHAHTYRCCIDVGNCAWHEHLIASVWVQPLLSIPGRRTCLLNVDGLGVNPALSDHENLHRLTYGFITMGSLEIDGRLEELAPAHLDWLKRLCSHIDRGYPVQCPDDAAYTGRPFPRVLFVDYPRTSPTYRRGVRKHVALLNWTDEPQLIGATAEQLRLKGTVSARDFWTDRTESFQGGDLCVKLPGRSARLYEIAT